MDTYLRARSYDGGSSDSDPSASGGENDSSLPRQQEVAELRAMIARRDKLNERIAQLKGKRTTFPSLFSGIFTSRRTDDGWDEAVAREWLAQSESRLIESGAVTLLMATVACMFLKLYYYTIKEDILLYNKDCRLAMLTPTPSPRLIARSVEMLWLVVTSLLLLVCTKRPRACLYYPILVSFSVYAVISLLPPLVPSCEEWAEALRGCPLQYLGGQDCELQGYTYMQALMSWILLTPLAVPRLKHMLFTWVWLFGVYGGMTIYIKFVRKPKEQHNLFDFAVSLVFLMLVNVMACIAKSRKERDQQSKFLMVLKEKQASKHMFHILNFMVPQFVIIPMISDPGGTIAEHVRRASILFAMLVDFDQTARRLPPNELLAILNQYFTMLDQMCLRHGVTKIETVGEEYVCAVGVVPTDRDEDQANGHRHILGKLLHVASDIMRLQAETNGAAVFKLGIHTGPVVAGVIGNKLPRFRLFGDTINTAARMMQRGLPGELQFGAETYRELPQWARAVARHRGAIEMKGKGLVEAYLLDSKASKHLLPTEMRMIFAQCRGHLSNSGLLPLLISGSEDMTDEDLPGVDQFEEAIHAVKTSVPTRSSNGDVGLADWAWFFTLRPGGHDYTERMEEGFQEWYYINQICKKLAARLERHVCVLASLTIFEVSYLICFEIDQPYIRLGRYLTCRAGALLLILAWRGVSASSGGLLAWPNESQWLLLVSYCVVASLVFVSYDFTAGLQFRSVTSIYNANIGELMCFPVYIMITKAHRLLFHYSVYFIPLAVMLGVGQKAGMLPGGMLFSEAGVILFIANSLLHAFETYNEEANLRGWYTAKSAVDMTHDRIETILNTLMPPMVLEAIRASPVDLAKSSHHYRAATVVQSDLCGFTQLASTRPPEAVVEFISELFGMFDDLTDLHEVYKVETVGDAYIAAQAEQPLTGRNSPLRVLLFGLDVVKATHQWSRKRGEAVSCRVGIHFGECIGGIVGTDMQRYHLFGALMTGLEVLESTAPRGRVQVSSACKAAVERNAREEQVPMDGVIFEARADPVLQTSKGEVHEYGEVGGPTFIIRDYARVGLHY